MEKLPGGSLTLGPWEDDPPPPRKLLPTEAWTLCCLTWEGDDIQVPLQHSLADSWTPITELNLKVQQVLVEREGGRVGT